MAPAEIRGGDDDILGPIGPGISPTARPVAQPIDTRPCVAAGADDDILGALAPEAAATATGKTGVLSAQAEQRIREQTAAAATAATTATRALLAAGHSTVRASLPRLGDAARSLRDTGIRHWRFLAVAVAICALALGAVAVGPRLIRDWSHRARAPQTVAVTTPHAVAPVTPRLHPIARPGSIAQPVRVARPVAVARVDRQAAVVAAVVKPSQPPAPRMTHSVARTPTAPVRSSAAARAAAARALTAEERFFRHQGGGGG